MTPHPPAVVTASAVCTPLGFSAAAVDAAIRGGIIPITETPVIGQSGEPLKACSADFLDPESPRSERLRMLTSLALEGFPRRERGPRPSAVFLSLPDARSGTARDTSWMRNIVDMIAGACHVRADSVKVVRNGRSSFFFALQAGLEELAAGRVDSIVVGGVDSLCDGETLQGLDDEHRLPGGSVASALLPGEGAGFVCLEHAERTPRTDETSRAAVLAVTTGREAHHFRQEEPNQADGLATVFKELRARAPGVRADICYTCETGEPFWTEELAFAYLRHGELLPEPFRRTMAAEAFGDLGAAAGPVLMAVGVHALARLEQHTAPVLLLCGSSDDGHVGGCLVRALPRST